MLCSLCTNIESAATRRCNVHFRLSIQYLIFVLFATMTLMSVETGSAPTTGIKVKRPVFGGACKLCPWGALGEIVKQAMQPYGYDV